MGRRSHLSLRELSGVADGADAMNKGAWEVCYTKAHDSIGYHVGEHPRGCPVCKLREEKDALRQRHAEAVEAAWREGRESGWMTCPNGEVPTDEQDDAAWLASSAKAALEQTP
jgi:hypothetical protein